MWSSLVSKVGGRSGWDAAVPRTSRAATCVPVIIDHHAHALLCTFMLQVQLQHNSLSGALPTQLGNMRSLVRLRMEENAFSGIFPHQLCAEVAPRLNMCVLQPSVFTCPVGADFPKCASSQCGVTCRLPNGMLA